VHVILDDSWVWLGGVPSGLLKLIDRATSYSVEGAWFSPSFRNHRWDGKEHLLALHARTMRWRAPAGTAATISRVIHTRFKPGQYKLTDNRTRPPPELKFNWTDGPNLRPHQLEAIEVATTPQGKWKTVGHGILRMSIRSGKTRTAAGIIAKFGVSTLFIVTSQHLMDQAREVLGLSLGRMIGQIGDSVWNEEPVTVATIQSLARARDRHPNKKLLEKAKNELAKAREARDVAQVDEWKARIKQYKTNALEKNKRYKRLMAETKLVIFDEVHHLDADKWRDVVEDSLAPYKLGLTATLDDDGPQKRGSILVRAATGRVLIEVTASQMIDAGYLMRPDIRLIPMREPDGYANKDWSKTLWDKCIFNNRTRNARIVQEAMALKNTGHRVLIVTNRLLQIRVLQRGLEAAGAVVAAVTGAMPVDERKDVIARYLAGTYDVMVGTVLGEGVDIPELDVVINAGGGEDQKAAMQRMRNLTPHHGKTEAIFIDFMDLMNPYFAAHSQSRLALYKSEPAFKVRVTP
jgi:superfamily II DNA or RNA helicase